MGKDVSALLAVCLPGCGSDRAAELVAAGLVLSAAAVCAAEAGPRLEPARVHALVVGVLEWPYRSLGSFSKRGRAKILATDGDSHWITCPGWDASWNEWVPKARIRQR